MSEDEKHSETEPKPVTSCILSSLAKNSSARTIKIAAFTVRTRTIEDREFVKAIWKGLLIVRVVINR